MTARRAVRLGRLARLGRLILGAAADRAEQAALRLLPRPRGLAHARPDATSGQLRAAVALGARFLEARQRGSGCWKGFLLPPGASTAWLTAHVAFVLEEVPELLPACRRAAGYLAAIGPDDGGWGYNRRVAVDCDSTAQALLVLHRFGLPIHPFLIDALLAAQESSGGFPTYRPDEPGRPASGWQVAHPDVSALVAVALRRLDRPEETERCLDWLRGQRGETTGVAPAVANCWASYWWSGTAYGLWAQARAGLLEPRAEASIREAVATEHSAPQLAMALSAATALGLRDAVDEAAGRLLIQQLADGSWPCAPCLRVTSPKVHVAAPGDGAALGPSYADATRIFSTAHAVAALHGAAGRG
jgi:hypothetical protein